MGRTFIFFFKQKSNVQYKYLKEQNPLGVKYKYLKTRKSKYRVFIKFKGYQIVRPMLMPFNQLQPAPQKVDICFYNALEKHLSNYKCEMAFYILRGLIVAWYLVQHLMLQQTDDANVYGLITLLFFVLLIMNAGNFWFISWTYRNFFTNSNTMNQIAQRIQHSQSIEEDNPTEPFTYFIPFPSMDLKVSKTYYQFQNNILLTDIDEEYKKRAQRNCSALISQQIAVNQGIRYWTQLFNLASISIFTYTIVLLSQGKGVTENQFWFLECYLFTEICSRFFIYFILTIIGLSPLCCLGFCIYSCFFKKEKIVKLPPAEQATLAIVNECEGNCPICYQNINLKQQVIVLKCSPKHVFHDICIKGWSSLGKDTCPVCRAEIV